MGWIGSPGGRGYRAPYGANNGKKSRHSLNGWGGSSSQVPLLTDRWFGESDLASSNKGYTGYREVLGGIGGPNQANLEA